VNSDNEFKYFHHYYGLAKEGKVPPLACDCGFLYTVWIKNGDLVLYCAKDDTDVVPGVALRRTVEQAVEAHL
jgi:hypothetical protein